MQSWEFFNAARAIVGADRMRAPLGLRAVQSVHALCNPTVEEDPDSYGVRNPVDRMDDLKDILSSYPEGRALLNRWQTREDREHARRVGSVLRQKLTPATLAKETSDAVREFADFLACCTPHGFDADRLVQEASEAVAEIQDLIHAAKSWKEESDLTRIEPHPRTLRAG